MPCGQNCRRLSPGPGIKIEPDCCGGCQVSIDPETFPATAMPAATPYAATPPGVQYETPLGAQLKADEARRAAEACCAANAAAISGLVARINALPDPSRGYETPAGAQAKADAALAAALAAAREEIQAAIDELTAKANSTG